MATARPARQKRRSFSLHVVGNGFVAAVLDVASVNAEGRQTFLRMAGQHGSQINRAGTFRAVESPDRLGNGRVHVHGLAAVTPAGRDREGNAHAFARKFFSASRGLSHAANARVRNHAIHRLAVGVTKLFGDEFGDRFGQVHRLSFERFAHATQASIDGGTNSNLRQFSEQRIFHNLKSLQIADRPAPVMFVRPVFDPVGKRFI